MVVQKVVREVIKQLAKEYGVSFNEARRIVYDSTFRLLANGIMEGNSGDIDSFKNIHLPHFGSFYMNPYREYLVTENKKKKNEKRDRELQPNE